MSCHPNNARRTGKHRFQCIALATGVFVVLGACLGCQQKMADQPSLAPLESSEFFGDGRASRDLVEGTVPRGHLRTDAHLYTGRVAENASGTQQGNQQNQNNQNQNNQDKENNNQNNQTAAQKMFARPAFVDTFPFPITKEILTLGYHRYMIYCVVCHDPLGTGRGTIVERGYTQPPSYHIERLRKVPPGHLFAVISEGYGSMPSYGDQIPPHDRWAIAAYVRALQLSQHFPKDQLTPDMQSEWNKTQARQKEEGK